MVTRDTHRQVSPVGSEQSDRMQGVDRIGCDQMVQVMKNSVKQKCNYLSFGSMTFIATMSFI